MNDPACKQLDPEGKNLEELKEIQLDIESLVSFNDSFEPLKNIAGADCSYTGTRLLQLWCCRMRIPSRFFEQKDIVQPAMFWVARQ